MYKISFTNRLIIKNHTSDLRTTIYCFDCCRMCMRLFSWGGAHNS